jgi:hypothetical protein
MHSETQLIRYCGKEMNLINFPEVLRLVVSNYAGPEN